MASHLLLRSNSKPEFLVLGYTSHLWVNIGISSAVLTTRLKGPHPLWFWSGWIGYGRRRSRRNRAVIFVCLPPNPVCASLFLTWTGRRLLRGSPDFRFALSPQLSSSVSFPSRYSVWPLRSLASGTLGARNVCDQHMQLLIRKTRSFAGPVPHDVGYYTKCMLGGVLACGLTHAAITPLDVAKCNMQASPVLAF